MLTLGDRMKSIMLNNERVINIFTAILSIEYMYKMYTCIYTSESVLALSTLGRPWL